VKPTSTTSSGRTQCTERRRLPLDALELLRERVERPLVVPRAHSSRVDEIVVLVVADEKGPETATRTFRIRESSNHELLAIHALELQPVLGARVHVLAVGALGDDSLPSLATGIAVVSLAVAVAMRRVAYRILECDGALQQPLAVPKGQLRRVVARHVQKVEEVEVNRDPGLPRAVGIANAGAALQAGKARHLAIEGDDLAVGDEVRAGIALERLGELRKALGQILAVARHDAHAIAFAKHEAADTVQLALVDPVRAREDLVGEHGQHRRGPLGLAFLAQPLARGLIQYVENVAGIHDQSLPLSARRGGRRGAPPPVLQRGGAPGGASPQPSRRGDYRSDRA